VGARGLVWMQVCACSWGLQWANAWAQQTAFGEVPDNLLQVATQLLVRDTHYACWYRTRAGARCMCTWRAQESWARLACLQADGSIRGAQQPMPEAGCSLE
jgi:hypothetical protein